MRTSIWYHTADQQPEKSGYYMGFRTITLADDTCGVDYFYWNKDEKQWRTDNTAHHRWANVYYWTLEDPEKWMESDPPVRNRKKHQADNPALQIAWDRVQESIRQYEIVRNLVG